MVFDLSAASLPVIATDVKMNVYYVADATQKVYAIGYRDPSEATPMDVFNNTDKICYSGTWYNAGSPEAIALADSNGDGVPDRFGPYAHTIKDIFARASATGSTSPASADNFTFSSPTVLTAGSASRRLGFMLTDYDFSYNFSEVWSSVVGPPPWPFTLTSPMHSGTGFIAQTTYDGDFFYGAMQNIRGSRIWWGASIIFANKANEDAECGWSNIPE